MFVSGALMLASASSPSWSELNEPSPGFENIRISLDGAGPSHLFRVGSDTNGDMIGIVDPLFAAIRLYRVEPMANGRALRDRVFDIGACALPVKFRPWRLHQLNDAVVIESMPNPGTTGFQVKPDALRTTLYTINRKQLLSLQAQSLRDAGNAIDTPQWDPSKAVECGLLDPAERRVGTANPTIAVRGAKNPARTIILDNAESALAPRTRLVVRAERPGEFALLSARELEPTDTHRIVQISEAVPANDGILRIKQRLLVFAQTTTTTNLVRQVTFDDRFLRSKIGQRPIAILSTGEVLAMGKYRFENVSAFRLITCGLALSTKPDSSLPSLCRDDGNDMKAREKADTVAAAEVPAKPFDGVVDEGARFTSRRLFANVEPLASKEWNVDTRELPEICRSAKGCSVNGQEKPFVPIRGIRLTRGDYHQRGVPYAQAEVPEDYRRFLAQTDQERTAALKKARDGAGALPGNLGDDFSGDLGIDCSGLVQIAWKGSERFSTASIQRFEHDEVCKSRIPEARFLKPGDALNLNVAGMTNHVMLFGAALRLYDANDTWMMLESASGCDGVCWSFYDPSFFNGWGMYRSSGRTDAPCPQKTVERSTIISDKFEGWSQQVN